MRIRVSARGLWSGVRYAESLTLRHVGLHDDEAVALELGGAVDVREAEERARHLAGQLVAQLPLRPAQQPQHAVLVRGGEDRLQLRDALLRVLRRACAK